VGTMLVSVPLAWLAYERNEVRKREVAIAEIEKLGGTMEFNHAKPFRSGWLGPLSGDSTPGEIVEVNFTRQKVTDAELIHLAGLRELKSLFLQGTMVTDAGLGNLAGLTELERLSLSSTLVTDAGLAKLTAFRKLEYLYLTHTQVTDEGLIQLNNLSELKLLDLNGTLVTDAGIPHFAKLKKLEALDLRATKVTKQVVSELQEILPNVVVVNDYNLHGLVD